jgi:hypothetical protein
MSRFSGCSVYEEWEAPRYGSLLKPRHFDIYALCLKHALITLSALVYLYMYKYEGFRLSFRDAISP